MLIEIDVSIADEIGGLRHDPRFRSAMSNLALGHREGKHLVTARYAVLEELVRCEALDEPTRETFRRIESRNQDGKILLERVRYFVRVCDEGGSSSHTGMAAEHRGQTCFRAPYHFFDDSSRIQATCLLAEDAEDAKLYELVARAYVASEKDLHGIEIRCFQRGGGGSNTADELRTAASERLVLCIVDSDRDWSGGALGETARQALQVREDLEQAGAIAHVHVLPCRHVENLLPGNLVMDALPMDAEPGFRSRCERARQLEILGGEGLFHYLHVKNGLLLCDVFAARPKEKQDFLRAVCQRFARPAARWCQEECERDTEHRQPCRVFEGLGDHLFRHVVAHAGELTPHKLAEHLFSTKEQQRDCGPIWADLGEVLLSWTCAFKPIRA